MQYPNTNLYAGIPFTVSCLIKTPTFVSIPVKIIWTKNGMVLPESTLYDTDTTFVNTTATILSRLWVNESHPGIMYYTCSCDAEVNTYSVFEKTQSTPGLFIQGNGYDLCMTVGREVYCCSAAYPLPELTVTTEPGNGPKNKFPYTMRCTASTNTGSPLQLAWTDQNGAQIEKRNDRIFLLDTENNNSRSLSLTFTEVIPADEGTYHCSVVLALTQLQHNISTSISIALTVPGRGHI